MRAIDLSTLVGHPGELVTVTEYSVPGDGGGGIFEWFPVHPLPVPNFFPEDGGIVFGEPSLTGRWIRQWSGYVNVRWFGARGDGKGYDAYDPDAIHPLYGIGDTERIQMAIDFCSQLQAKGEIVGGTVFFPPGVYIVTVVPHKNPDPHKPPPPPPPFKIQMKSQVNLLGCGSSSQLVSARGQNPTSHTLWSDENALLKDVRIESLLIDGRESHQPPRVPGKPIERAAIFAGVSEGLRIIDCVFQDTADTIRLYKQCTGSHVRGNEIRNNLVNVHRECIAIAGAYNSIVESNYVHDCPFSNGVKMEGAHPGTDFSNIIRGNILKAVGAGITAKGGCIVADNVIEATLNQGAIVGHHCHFLGNRITSAVQAGIQILDNSEDTHDVVVANNSVTNVHNPGADACDGIVGEFQTNCQKDSLGNCVKDPLTGQDIEVIYVPSEIMITNNIIDYRTSQHGKGLFNGIRFHSVGSRISIQNNQIYAVDRGIVMDPETPDRSFSTDQFRANDNTITVNENGVGIRLNADTHKNASLRHVIVSGNLVENVQPTVGQNAKTNGIFISGDLDRVLLTANDTSATDVPYKQTGGPPTNMVRANNNGF
jgi:hypothetical protein